MGPRRLILLAALACAGCVERAGSDGDRGDADLAADLGADRGEQDNSDAGSSDAASDAPTDAAADAQPAANGCPEACAAVVECAVERCAALADADRPPLNQICLDRCAELPSIGPVVAGLTACDEIAAFTEQAIPGILDPCVFDPAFPPNAPICAVYGARLAECLTDRCPPAAEQQATLAAGFTHECDVAVAGGADPSGVEAIADAPCDAWAEAADNRVSNDLAAFCARGPLDEPDACRAACATAAACLNPDAEANQPFRNPDRCAMLCVASTDAPRGWACLAERMTCDAIEPCFARGPEPACRVEADRVVECVEAACPPVAPLADGLRGLLVSGCDAAVANRSRAIAEVEAAAAAEDCADDPLATQVTLVIDRPNDPSNALGPTCADGPRDPALCAPACAALGRCLDGGNVLTDADVCAFYCGTTATYPDAAWRCAGEANGCEATVACFGEGG